MNDTPSPVVISRTKKSKRNLILFFKYVFPIIVAVLIFLGFKYYTKTYRMVELDLAKYKSLVAAEKQSMVFVTSNDCDTCVKTKDLLKKMLQGSKIKTYEINVDKLTDDERDEFMGVISETKESITSPGLLIVKENALLSSFYGPFEEDGIITFLQDNDLVKRVNTNE